MPRTPKSILPIMTALMAVSCAAPATADVIDFESAEKFGGDNAAISDSYFSQFGVAMTMYAGRRERNASQVSARFEQVGGADGGDAFNYADSSGSIVYGPGLGGDLGNYYLAYSDNLRTLRNTGYLRLDIDYRDPVSQASGELWDLDENFYGTEQFTVTGFDADGKALASVTSPEVSYSKNYDGLPWTWKLAGDDISRIEIESVGSRTNYLGIAFDNFSFSSDSDSHAAPLPAAFWPGIAALGGLGIVRRKRRRDTMSENEQDNQAAV